MSRAIRIESLGKKYRVNRAVESVEYQTLREVIGRAALAPWRRLRQGKRQRCEDFWALRDVNLEIAHGEAVGIIGRNGAGKSTLLKILSRITKPTTGCVKLYGRVASLLEVGTGFHPELTGRENIFLNGSVLGMSRFEIQRKFDEIVEFSGVERFLDTPIKRYSSGMKVRLAFAVAAHLEPEILVIDEVLAVGDAEFQKKCLGKMNDVAHSGRTILFVSHNMAAVESLCSRCVVIQDGSLAFTGATAAAIAKYNSVVAPADQEDLSLRTDRTGIGDLQFHSLSIFDENEVLVDTISMGRPARIRLTVRSHALDGPVEIALKFFTSSGQRLFRLHSGDYGCATRHLSADDTLTIDIPSLPLLPGSYRIDLAAADAQGRIQDSIENAATFHVTPADVLGTGRVPRGPGDLIFVPATWTRSTNAPTVAEP